MKIRFAKSRDKKSVLFLLNELGQVINENIEYSFENTQAHVLGSDNYDKAMRKKDIKVFILEDSELIIGMASYFILVDFITGSKFAHIDDFVISKNYRGKGYGKSLMKGILDYSKKNDILTVKLTSSIQLRRAHLFYEKLGGKFTQKVIKFSL